MVSNPFRAGHCCAPGLPKVEPRIFPEFQTPSERGIAVHLAKNCSPAHVGGFQTPSERGIAVHSPTAMAATAAPLCFKPLQSGALLCTCPKGQLCDGCSSFKPLQSGALLCTHIPPRCGGYGLLVSNPFRAGHCCAHGEITTQQVELAGFKPLQSGALLCTSCREHSPPGRI